MNSMVKNGTSYAPSIKKRNETDFYEYLSSLGFKQRLNPDSNNSFFKTKNQDSYVLKTKNIENNIKMKP